MAMATVITSGLPTASSSEVVVTIATLYVGCYSTFSEKGDQECPGHDF